MQRQVLWLASAVVVAFGIAAAAQAPAAGAAVPVRGTSVRRMPPGTGAAPARAPGPVLGRSWRGGAGRAARR